jgi:hypothetical protein
MSALGDAFWAAWGNLLNHVVPLDGERCATCASASDLRTGGCEEGQRLRREFRDAPSAQPA